MTQNVIERSDAFEHIKSIFIQAALIELSRFNSSSPLNGPSEQECLVSYIAHCGKELKIHTLPNNLPAINSEVFDSDIIRTFVLCVADRFFIEIKPFENILYDHLSGVFHIKDVPNITVIHKDLLASVITDISNQDKDVVKFFEANSWVVCVIMLLLTHQNIISQISLKK